LLCNRLWKWLASSSPIDGTALGQLSGKQFSLFMEMVCYRLWKWYVTALGNLTKLPKRICNRFRQPLMEMVCYRLSSYLPCYATVYGNGWQAVLPLMELRSQLETERADREEIEAELSELKQNSAPAAIVSEKLTPDTARILSLLRARRKKSKTDLADLEAILEVLES
jgi:hypothetical protein